MLHLKNKLPGSFAAACGEDETGGVTEDITKVTCLACKLLIKLEDGCSKCGNGLEEGAEHIYTAFGNEVFCVQCAADLCDVTVQTRKLAAAALGIILSHAYDLDNMRQIVIYTGIHQR